MQDANCGDGGGESIQEEVSRGSLLDIYYRFSNDRIVVVAKADGSRHARGCHIGISDHMIRENRPNKHVQPHIRHTYLAFEIS